MPEGNQSIPNALQRIQGGGDHKAPLCCPLLIEYNGIGLYRHVLEPATGLRV